MATIHQFAPKTSAAMLRCPSCGTTTDAPCSCGIGYEYISPSKLAEQGIKDNPGLSNREIAKKIGVGKDTIRRARPTGANAPVEPRIGKDGKTRRMPHTKAKRTGPQPDRRHDALEAAACVLDEGLTYEQAAERCNVSLQTVRASVQREEGRREAQPNITPDMLSMTAQQKLDAVMRQHRRKLDDKHKVRMRGLDEEVRQRVLSEGKNYLASLNEMREKAWDSEKLYRELIDNHKPPFTKDQFKTILMCLHPDGQRTADKLSEAFRLFNNKKLQLTGEK